jgi:hypothetical protein
VIIGFVLRFRVPSGAREADVASDVAVGAAVDR